MNKRSMGQRTKRLCMGLALGAQLAMAGPAAASLYIDHPGYCGGDSPMALNSSASGGIQWAGDVDYFHVDVPSNGRLTVYTTGSTDTFGTLENSSCVALVSNDDQPSNLNFRIDRSVGPGRYYIRVRHYSASGTGSYGLTVSFAPAVPVDDHGNSCSTATTSSMGWSLNGNIGQPGDVDFFKVWIPGNCSYCANPLFEIWSTGRTDTYGTLYNASCQAIRTDDDSGEGLNFYIGNYGGPGQFYIGIRHYSPSGTGSYVFGNRVRY